MVRSPLSFAQERMWFLYQLSPEAAAYNIPPASLHGPLNKPSLRWAVDELVRRHDALRTTVCPGRRTTAPDHP